MGDWCDGLCDVLGRRVTQHGQRARPTIIAPLPVPAPPRSPGATRSGPWRGRARWQRTVGLCKALQSLAKHALFALFWLIKSATGFDRRRSEGMVCSTLDLMAMPLRRVTADCRLWTRAGPSRTLRSGAVGAPFQLAAACGVGPSGGMPPALVIALTSEARRARPPIRSWARGHPPYGLL